jgi:hypothetical protein
MQYPCIIYSGKTEKVAFFYSDRDVFSALPISQGQNFVPQQISMPDLEGRQEPVICVATQLAEKVKEAKQKATVAP